MIARNTLVGNEYQGSPLDQYCETVEPVVVRVFCWHPPLKPWTTRCFVAELEKQLLADAIHSIEIPNAQRYDVNVRSILFYVLYAMWKALK